MTIQEELALAYNRIQELSNMQELLRARLKHSLQNVIDCDLQIPEILAIHVLDAGEEAIQQLLANQKPQPEPQAVIDQAALDADFRNFMKNLGIEDGEI